MAKKQIKKGDRDGYSVKMTVEVFNPAGKLISATPQVWSNMTHRDTIDCQSGIANGIFTLAYADADKEIVVDE